MSQNGIYVKTVQIEFFVIEIVISIHISSFKENANMKKKSWKLNTCKKFYDNLVQTLLDQLKMVWGAIMCTAKILYFLDITLLLGSHQAVTRQ